MYHFKVSSNFLDVTIDDLEIKANDCDSQADTGGELQGGFNERC